MATALCSAPGLSSGLRQEIAHSHDIVTEFAEQVAEILGDVLVE